MIEALEANITCVIREIPTQMLKRVIENWTLRMDKLKRSCGQHLNGIIFKKQMPRVVSKVVST